MSATPGNLTSNETSNSGKKPLRYPADWVRRKEAGEPISVITAYDATMARLVATSEVDAILVGDSLTMVVQGHNSTIPITMDEIIYHCRMVRRGAPDAFIIGDMPFGSFQAGLESGVNAAFRLMKEGHVNAVKMEGATPLTLEIIERLSLAGVPVMGHIGLTPQSYLNLGGFRVQGRDEKKAAALRQSAKNLEGAGCFSIILELLVSEQARQITAESGIPTIGIGAGKSCSGQVLVVNDLLGMDPIFKPRHVKQYARLADTIQTALNEFHREVSEGEFPGDENIFR